ncbi:MAG: hypothetical protein PQ612_02710 [Rickettsiales bacterium]|nr:hypothetical protein [Pseudomonadota bacterium]MDA0965976.1 hypothetical protein [Pseudomonadota bacterium]MDG4542553.1 hypothetical protein [Rickettsiales bacterium]MDG4545057.1 hypothetical protein [Rickettsiales bacterium]MDG4547180.1 hypothetical protein [Rickettsiales bacterium]
MSKDNNNFHRKRPARNTYGNDTKRPKTDTQSISYGPITTSHSIDVRQNDYLGGQKTPNYVRTTQINAAARAKEGGLEKHYIHTNQPLDFYKDITISGMDIAMPLHEQHLGIIDIANNKLENNADRINDFISELSLIREKPIISLDHQKTFIEGYYFDRRTLDINGDHKRYSEEAETSNTIDTYRFVKEMYDQTYADADDWIERGSIQDEVYKGTYPPNIEGIMPSTPIRPIEFEQDIISPNQDATDEFNEVFSAGAAAINDRTDMALEMAARRLKMAKSDYRTTPDIDDILLEKKIVKEGAIGSLLKDIISEDHITKEPKGTIMNLSGHNAESILPSSSELYNENLMHTSGMVFGFRTGSNEIEQSQINEQLAKVLDPKEKVPIVCGSEGRWQQLLNSQRSKDGLSLGGRSPY